jgi:hypothetical protein
MKIDDNEKDFLKFYMEQTWEEMRHIENLREKTTIMIVTISVAIVGFVVQQKFASETKLLVYFEIALGLFGLLMSIKQFQLHQMDQNRLDKWYSYYESFCGEDAQILKLRDKADIENKKRFKYIKWIRHNYFWSTIYVFIIVSGFILLNYYQSK